MGLLRVEELSKRFGGLRAIKNLEFEMKEGEILGLIGPNGSGKTTLFNLITSLIKADRGGIYFYGEDITNYSPSKIAQKGIARTFQLTTLFEELSVKENVVLGGSRIHKLGLEAVWKILFAPSSYQRMLKYSEESASETLKLLGLNPIRDVIAKNLPYGTQRILMLAIALETNPKLLLLDEVMAGMNPEETQTIMRLIWNINQKGITIFLIEHRMKSVMELCDRIIVLNFGEKIAEGAPKEIQNNNDVIDAYLGSEDEYA